MYVPMYVHVTQNNLFQSSPRGKTRIWVYDVIGWQNRVTFETYSLAILADVMSLLNVQRSSNSLSDSV